MPPIHSRVRRSSSPIFYFWTRIYTKVTTNGGLIHDDRYLEIVYEEIAVRCERRRRASGSNAWRTRAIATDASCGASRVGARERMDDRGQAGHGLWPDRLRPRDLSAAAEHVRFQLGQSDRFREGLMRSGEWEAHIAETLATRGLPKEIAALPHVESSFNAAAYSKVGAAGLWQFMRSTGRRFMRIDAVVDERMDPLQVDSRRRAAAAVQLHAAGQLAARDHRL